MCGLSLPEFLGGFIISEEIMARLIFAIISSLMMSPPEKFREGQPRMRISPAVRKNAWHPAPANGCRSGCCRKFSECDPIRAAAAPGSTGSSVLCGRAP